MTDRRSELEVVERALVELDAAERARVFQRTAVDAEQLVVVTARHEVSRSWRIALSLLASAAALAVMVGAWNWVSVQEPGGLHELVRVAAVPVRAYDGGEGSFYRCFGGPSEAVVTNCQGHDYDADGDVDLADFRTFELAFADASRVSEFEAR